MVRKLCFVFFPLVLITANIQSQEVYQHISNRSIYTFLDEMANEHFIEINSAVKPYSRMFIANKLKEINDSSATFLDQRQSKELQFYLKDYNKELLPGKDYDKRFDIFYYKDSLFTFSLNAILGIQYWNNENGGNYHRWNGAEVFSYIGKHVGIYFNLRDNHEEKQLSETFAPAGGMKDTSLNFLSPRPGPVYKSGYDFSEMRGGITYSWNWGSIGLIKDHLQWGSYYHYPSIISDKAPSFAQLKLVMKPVKWFEFNYIHGWLVSGITDSVRSYSYTNSYGTSTRKVFQNKYIASNLFSFKPFKNFYASIGNSIVYSDVNVQPAFLIPFLFYKSVDHTLSDYQGNESGNNSQLFLDFSSRQIKHLHLYATFFFDDISIERLKENGHLDFYSMNLGFRVSNLIPNTYLTFEYFQSYPLVYKHDMPTTTYESNFYNMGHYLQDNSRGVFVALNFKPFRGLDIEARYTLGQHGRDHEELGTVRKEVVHYFMDAIEWQQDLFGLSVQYQILNDINLFSEYEYRHVTGNQDKYTAPYYHGTTNTFSVGVNYGF